jgi:cytochrome oxidase Cu insertion factor (SCO1/SenC/PrrC family)
VQGFDPQFNGLRGDAAVVQAEIARLGLAPSAADLARASDDPPHAAAVLAFARDGRGHFVYPPTTNPEAWLYDLRKLLRDSVP